MIWFVSLRSARALSWFGLLLTLTLAHGCGNKSDAKVVDFTKTTPVARPGDQPTQSPSLRVAVAAMISPRETFFNYRQLLEYIGSRLSQDIEFVQRKTYREINELFGKGEIDLAFICSGPYALGKARYDFDLLAVPEVNGNHFYHSYLIVNQDSPFHSLEDLRGRVFAFTDPDSNTGKLVPTYWLMQRGEGVERFFGETIYTYSHDNSILAVSRGLVDGAAVHGLIWEYYQRKHPSVTSKTRIIKKSEPYGIPPLVTSRFLSTELKERLSELLLSMHMDPEGRTILGEMMIDRFIPAREEWYDTIRQMKLTLNRSDREVHVVAKP